MTHDANLQFVSGTITADTNTTFDLREKGPLPTHRPMFVEYLYNSANVSASTGSVAVTVQESDSANTGFTTIATFSSIALTTTAKNAVLNVPVVTKKRSLRLAEDLTGTDATITRTAHLGLSST